MKEPDKTMYFRTRPEALESARILRIRMTETENLLYEKLRVSQIPGLRFRKPG